MTTLGKFFERAAHKISETVGNQPRTVDQDFEARKAEFKRFTTEFTQLWRRLELYFKDIKEDAKNFERIAESSKSIYNGHASEMSGVFEHLSQRTNDAMGFYETARLQLKDMLNK